MTHRWNLMRSWLTHMRRHRGGCVVAERERDCREMESAMASGYRVKIIWEDLAKVGAAGRTNGDKTSLSCLMSYLNLINRICVDSWGFNFESILACIYDVTYAQLLMQTIFLPSAANNLYLICQDRVCRAICECGPDAIARIAKSSSR